MTAEEKLAVFGDREQEGMAADYNRIGPVNAV
jgi:hypothetical protein